MAIKIVVRSFWKTIAVFPWMDRRLPSTVRFCYPTKHPEGIWGSLLETASCQKRRNEIERTCTMLIRPFKSSFHTTDSSEYSYLDVNDVCIQSISRFEARLFVWICRICWILASRLTGLIVHMLWILGDLCKGLPLFHAYHFSCVCERPISSSCLNLTSIGFSPPMITIWRFSQDLWNKISLVSGVHGFVEPICINVSMDGSTM